MVHLINAITTNKTDFFREPRHFDYLTQKALPILQNQHNFIGGTASRSGVPDARPVRSRIPWPWCWPRSRQQPGFRFEILATDISTRVLEIARRAVYPMGLIEPVTHLFRKKYLLKGATRKILKCGLFRNCAKNSLRPLEFHG